MEMTLKKYLLEKEIKLTTIAQKTGIDISRISKHLSESTKLPMKHIEKIAKYLDMTVEEVKLNKVKVKSLDDPFLEKCNELKKQNIDQVFNGESIVSVLEKSLLLNLYLHERILKLEEKLK